MPGVSSQARLLLARTTALVDSLGTRLREARVAARLTRHSAARKAGIDPSLLYRIETNAAKSPSFKTVAAVARVLNVSLDELAYGPAEGGISAAIPLLQAAINALQRP